MVDGALFAKYIVSSIDGLIACLDGFDTTALNWTPVEQGNSLAVIATHVLGSTEQSVLGILGGQTIDRDRDAEFVATITTADDLRARWARLRDQIPPILAGLADDDIAKQHPRGLTSGDILLLIARHTAEHLGQAQQVRDLLADRREVDEIRDSLFDTIDRLVATVVGLSDDQVNARPDLAEANSLTHMITHVLASVEENLVEVVGGDSVHRVRDREFVAESSAAALAAEWQRVRDRISPIFATITPATLDTVSQHPRRAGQTTRHFLNGAIRHAAEHLGEAQLTRMLVTV